MIMPLSIKASLAGTPKKRTDFRRRKFHDGTVKWDAIKNTDEHEISPSIKHSQRHEDPRNALELFDEAPYGKGVAPLSRARLTFEGPINERSFIFKFNLTIAVATKGKNEDAK